MSTHPALSIDGATQENLACATLEKEEDNETTSLAPTEPEGDMQTVDEETAHPSTHADASGFSLFEDGMGYEDSQPSSAAGTPSRNVPSPARNTRAKRAEEEEQARAARSPRVSPRRPGARVSGLTRGQGKRMRQE